MTRTQIFPYTMSLLSLCASALYALEPGRWRLAVYWLCASVISFVLGE